MGMNDEPGKCARNQLHGIRWNRRYGIGDNVAHPPAAAATATAAGLAEPDGRRAGERRRFGVDHFAEPRKRRPKQCRRIHRGRVADIGQQQNHKLHDLLHPVCDQSG